MASVLVSRASGDKSGKNHEAIAKANVSRPPLPPIIAGSIVGGLAFIFLIIVACIFANRRRWAASSGLHWSFDAQGCLQRFCHTTFLKAFILSPHRHLRIKRTRFKHHPTYLSPSDQVSSSKTCALSSRTTSPWYCLFKLAGAYELGVTLWIADEASDDWDLLRCI